MVWDSARIIYKWESGLGGTFLSQGDHGGNKRIISLDRVVQEISFVSRGHLKWKELFFVKKGPRQRTLEDMLEESVNCSNNILQKLHAYISQSDT